MPRFVRRLLTFAATDAVALALIVAGLGAEPPDLARAQAVSVLADPADCTASADGTARYFASVRSTSGTDITHAVGRLFGTGPENAGQHVNMSNGDFEAQADDGSSRGGCVPRPNDGRANDLASAFVPAMAGAHTWTLQVLATGYAPAAPIDLAPFVDGTVCPLGDGAGCLISLGTVLMTGVGIPSSSGGGTTAPTRVATPSGLLPAPPPRSLFPAPAPVTLATRVASATPTPTIQPPLLATATPVPRGPTDPTMAPTPGDGPILVPIDPIPLREVEPSVEPAREGVPVVTEAEPEREPSVVPVEDE